MERAAWLVAEDNLTDEEIAAEVKITRRQLTNWKLRPDFSARVSWHIAQITERVLSSGYCRTDKRVALLGKNIKRLEAVVAAQAQDPRVSDQPGAETGLITRKDIPTRFGTIQEYGVAVGILAEERALLKHIAQEAGQWTERLNVNFDPSALSDEELEAIARRTSGGGAGDPKA